MPLPLTAKQKAILDFMNDFAKEYKRTPNMSEIARHFNIKFTNGVRSHLRALGKKGHIQWKETGSAARIITNIDPRTMRLPFLGKETRRGEANIFGPSDDYMLADGMFFPERQGLFAYKVEGDRMIDAGIHHGDIVVACRWPGPPSGKIVVLKYKGETFLQRLTRQRAGNFTFRSENPNYRELKMKSGADFVIEGVVMSLWRPTI